MLKCCDASTRQMPVIHIYISGTFCFASFMNSRLPSLFRYLKRPPCLKVFVRESCVIKLYAFDHLSTLGINRNI